MSETAGEAAASLGDVDPAGSRHQGRRSAVTLTDDLVIAGTASGDLRAFARDALAERWAVDGEESVVAATAFGDAIAVGTRGERGRVRVHDAETGAERWRFETATDVGEPQRDTRFFLPFVADLVAEGDRLFAAARRYERGRDGDRTFESVVYAFEPDGTVAWRYDTDASPIALDVADDRVAVAYNRCPGDHQHGLVVLDRADGTPRWAWDPGTEGQRRVGDVSLRPDGAVVASHGDYCGYRLADNGAETWRVELAAERDVDGERVYAYPNHVHATDDGAVFVTGNTYPEDGRETDARHPNEHAAIGVDSDGARTWDASVGGFASGVAVAGDSIAVPGAQNFRERDPDDHGLCVLDVASGVREGLETDGIPTAAALDDDAVAFVEEPIVYHDEGVEHGAYRLRRRSID